MKSAKIAITVVSAIIVLGMSAFAQKGTVRAAIPFDFVVGKQMLNAGVYQITGQGQMLLVIRTDGKQGMIENTRLFRGGPREDATSQLIFNRYGQRYFLAKVWMSKAGSGHQLFASPLELEYARKVRSDATIVLASTQAPR